jgi:hypothetical protein
MIFHGIPTKSPRNQHQTWPFEWVRRGDWDRISTFDPLGMTAHPPTIAACKAKLDIPELKVGATGDPKVG